MLLWPATTVWSGEHIRLGAEDSWPPFSNADGTGLSNQIVREAFAAQGVSVDYYVAPYARLLKEVEEGRLLGAFNVTREPSTAARFHFCKEKLFSATTAYFHNTDRPLKARQFTEVGGGKRVGMIIGYEYGPYILNNKDILPIRVASQESLINMLIRKHVDAIIMFDTIANQTLPRVPGSEKIARAFDGETSDIYVAFSRNHPDTKRYCRLLDTGLVRLKQQGRIDAILTQSPR